MDIEPVVITDTSGTTTPTGTPKARKKKFSKKKVRDALVKAQGSKVDATKLIGCNRSTLNAYLKDDPELQELYDELIGGHIDDIEQAVFVQAKLGNISAATFVLRTIGKSRGYVEAKAQVINSDMRDEGKKILERLREGSITAADAAIGFDILGTPIPDSVRLLLSKEIVEPADPTAGQYSIVTDEELRKRVAERNKAISEQKGEFLGERREQVKELREQAKDSFGALGGVMDEGDGADGVDHG